ncbi:MAG: hypothetical protein AAF543_14450 [Pseudomonadota bacterium]
MAKGGGEEALMLTAFIWPLKLKMHFKGPPAKSKRMAENSG